MNAWLAFQCFFALSCWLFAARRVGSYHRFAAIAGRPLAATIRELSRAGRSADLSKLQTRLGVPVLEDLLDSEARPRGAEALIGAAQTVAGLTAPPVRLLRAMATAGTMLGLLAAVAGLRSGMDARTPGLMEGAAATAFDSAVLGFVTALPCWTAVALLRQRARAMLSELDLVVLAIASTGEPIPGPASGSEASDG